jgi:hypothetical protein
MAIQIQGNGGVVADVDGTTFRALRVTGRPLNYGSLGIYQAGASTGTMAAALAANSEIYQFRWPDATNLAVLYMARISAGANVAATAAALCQFRLTAARSWTVAGSGGTRLTLTGNNCKLRTSMATSLVNDAGISSTAALTAGTKTLDTTDFANTTMGIGTGAITVAVDLRFLDVVYLFDATSGMVMPYVMAQNEGFVIRTGANAFPATMTWAASVSVLWAEAAAY